MRKTANVVMIGDYVDPDFLAATQAAAHPESGLAVRGVIVTGRPVNPTPDPNHPCSGRDIELSRRRHVMNTARLAGALLRAGVDPADTPVFQGLDMGEAGTTDLTTTIPHSVHVDEERYDLWGDRLGQGSRAIAGGFEDATRHLEAQDGPLHIVAGGPFTEVAALLQVPQLAVKLGLLVGQGSFVDNSNTHFGRSFNVACDPVASQTVWERYPMPLYMVSSRITRDSRLVFHDVDAMVALGLPKELVALYAIHYRLVRDRLEAAGVKVQSSSMHDIHAVFLLQQLLGKAGASYMYTELAANGAAAARYEVTAYDPSDTDGSQYRGRLARFLARG